ARICLSWSSVVASTRWSYQSMASSSSPSDATARWRSIVAGRSFSASSCSPSLVGMGSSVPAGSVGSGRASQPGTSKRPRRRRPARSLLQLLADRVQLLPGVDDVRVEVPAVVGEDPVGAPVEDDDRLHRCGGAEGVGDLLQQRLDGGTSGEVLAVL